MKQQNFNKNWLFYRFGEPDTVRRLDLPHDAMIEEPRIPDLAGGDTSGFYPGGHYVYEKTFPTPDDDTVLLHFDGVHQKASVYLNGTLLGQQIQGYTNFSVSLTDHLLPNGAENRLRVEVDNTQVPNSRWYTGSGIYRDVTLCTANRRHIPLDGVQISTLSICPVRLQVRVESSGLSPLEYDDSTIEFELMSQLGQPIKFRQEHPHWEGSVWVAELVPESVCLWSAEHPTLYTLNARLRFGGIVQDEASVRCGIRLLQWNPQCGLLLNGKSIKLRGACVHHDNGILGACEFPETAYRKIAKLKECGYNAVRTAHNEPSRLLLDACDALGMYVMAEFTDVWRGTKNDYDYSLYFDRCSQPDLTRMVRKCMRHPSVVMYSIGNEVYDTRHTESYATCAALCNTIRSLDNSRPLTLGFNILGAAVAAKDTPLPPPRHRPDEQVDPCRSGRAAPLVSSKLMNTVTMFLPKLMELVTPEKLEKSEKALLDQLDIAGLNYGTHLNRLHQVNPQRMIVHTETFPSRIGDTWQETLAYPWVVGDFMWTGWDYLGETGLGVPEYGKTPRRLSKPYPCVSAGVGSINLVGEIEAQGHYTKAVYGCAQTPCIAVRPLQHTGEKRKMSNWRGTDAVCSWAWGQAYGKQAQIEVYSAMPVVELIQNGQSLGRKPTQKCMAVFQAEYRAGCLKAVAYNEQGQQTGSCLLESDDASEQLHIWAEKPCLKSGGLCYVFVEIVDSKGIRKAASQKLVTFSVSGGGKLLATGSGDPWARLPYTGRQAYTYFGSAAAVVQADAAPSSISITAFADGLDAVTLELPISE